MSDETATMKIIFRIIGWNEPSGKIKMELFLTNLKIIYSSINLYLRNLVVDEDEIKWPKKLEQTFKVVNKGEKFEKFVEGVFNKFSSKKKENDGKIDGNETSNIQ